MNKFFVFKALICMFLFINLPFVAKSVQTGKKSLKPDFLIYAESEVKAHSLSKKRILQIRGILKSRKLYRYHDLANLVLGKHYLKKSMQKRALVYFHKIKESSLKWQANLMLARSFYNLKKYSKALRLTEQIQNQKISISVQLLKELYHLKRLILLQQKPVNYQALLEVYSQLFALDNSEQSPYKKQIYRVLFNMKDDDVLNVTSADFIEPVKDIVFFHAGKILFYREKFNRAYTFFKKALRVSMDSLLERKILKHIRAIESRKTVNKRHIGVVLPLTGSSAKIGKRTLLGIQMGLGFYLQRKTSFRLIVLDSQGYVDKARKAVEKLVTQHHVIGIIGGVLSQTAEALAEEAQNFGIPVVLMSHKSNITKNKPYVFQNALTSKLVSHQLIDFLMIQLKAKRFALLYPNDPYGVDYANIFWSSVEQKGGIIAGAQMYQPGETNFNGPIRRLVGTYYLKDREKEYREKLKKRYQKHQISKKDHVDIKDLLPPVVDFDVLFIPDSAKALNLIAPHTAFNDIKNIYLAGTTLWNREQVIQKQSKYINKAFFVDTNLSRDSFRKTKFYQQFTKIFHQSPGLFEVQAYEAALAFRQAIAMGVKNRNELRNTLVQLTGFPGPIGPITVSKEGEFNRSLTVFKIENKQILPLSGDLLKTTQLDFW